MKLSILNDYEIMINHFIKLNWEKFGYINFRTFANSIKVTLNQQNEYIIRKIFNNLMQLNYIEKINQDHKYLYKFNNPENDRFGKQIIITFD